MTDEGKRLRSSIYATLFFIALIWGVKIIEYTFDFNFAVFGILPRTLEGSIGIFTAPLIHGDIYHLFANSVPILILGIGLFYFYDKIAVGVISIVYFTTGFWVWLAAREAYHIGASGLVYGVLTFLLFSGFIRRDSASLSLSFIVLFLYGGSFFAGILPEDSAVSWESHLMGAFAGVFCAIYYKNIKLAKASQELEVAEKAPASEYSYHYIYEANTGTTETEHKDPKIKKSYTIKYPLNSDQEG